MVSLIFPAQGNPIAIKRTIDSLEGIIDEVVIGNVSIFPDDREKILTYGNQINLKLIDAPFNFIFKNGFSNTLNILASYAKNDLVLYLNVGEILISSKEELLNKINPEYNYYYLIHPQEKHFWGRLYNKNELQWGGIIHEELVGNIRRCPEPIFMFDDTPKDSDDPIKAEAYLNIKELVYFNQYVKLIDQPHLIANTNQGWVDFARDGYHSFIERMHQKGDMYEAFLTGDYELLMKSINNKKSKS